MSKPANVVNNKKSRIDEIETTSGAPINISNAAGISFMGGLFTACGGVFSQVEPKSATGDIAGEQEITNTNNAMGTLYRVANTAIKGGTSRIEAHGNFTSATGRDLKLTWKLGNHILGTTGVMNMSRNHNSTGWHVKLIMCVRELGDEGTAILSTTGFMQWLEKTGAETEQYDLNSINNTTYETTQTETFSLVAEWSNGSDASDVITLENCIINKLF